MRLAEPTRAERHPAEFRPLDDPAASGGPRALAVGDPFAPLWTGPGNADGIADHRDDRGSDAGAGGGSRPDHSGGDALDSRREQHESVAALARGAALDAVTFDAAPLPRRGGSGLPVPRFGPEAQVSVLLPAWEPLGQVSPGEALAAALHGEAPAGKRKASKAFRVPGDRTQVALTGGSIIAGDDGRSGTFHTQGRSVTAGSQRPGLTASGAAAVADALYTAGILREADWCGSLERSLRRGLARWVNEEKGAAQWRILPAALSLVYTDDGPAYSTGVRLPRWRDHFKARSDRPVGFLALRFQSPPRAVHVRTMTQRLEAAWPGLGFGVLNLVENAFATSVQGYGFGWGAQLAKQWQMLDAMDDSLGWRDDSLGWRDDSLGWRDDSLGWRESSADPESEGRGVYDEYDFFRSVPKAAVQTPFKLDQLQHAANAAPQKHPDLVPAIDAALALWAACRRSGTTFYTLNHCRFLSWRMSASRRDYKIEMLEIDHLDRAPVVHMVWDPEADVMTRLVDDYTELCRKTMQFTDLTWMHGFQIGHAGHEPEKARRQLAAHDRATRKAIKSHPEALSFHDPDYQIRSMPDGSLAHAAEALDIVLDILGALDRLLTLLHKPETLAEQYTLAEQCRAEQSRGGDL